MNIEQARDAVNVFIDQDIPAFLWGAPGVGKSDLMRSVAKLRDWPLIDFRATLRDPVDLRGLPSIDSDSGTAKWLPPSDLPDASRDGDEGLLFLDELNAAPMSVQAACFGLVLDRRVGEYQLPPGWRIVAAGNRQKDRAAANRMPSALANRFAHIDVEPDPRAWAAWAASENLHPAVIAFVRFRPELLHKMDGDELRTFPTPRAWQQVAKLVDQPDSIRFDLIAALVGEAAAGEMEGFIQIWKSLPPLESIVRDPHGAPVPEEPGVQYAVSSALARYATVKNFDSVMDYGERLPGDFQTVLAMEATRRDPALMETAAYTQWSVHTGAI